MALSIPLILGTAREGRRSEHVAQYLLERLSDRDDIDIELIDVRHHLHGFTHPAWIEYEETNAWKETALAADGYIIVTPEYNHGYPGELKIFLDGAFEEYFDKPVALAGVSSGRLGGARVVEHIKPVLIELGMTPMGKALYFGNAGDVFDDSGEMTDESRELYDELVDEWANTLLAYARALKEVRG